MLSRINILLYIGNLLATNLGFHELAYFFSLPSINIPTRKKRSNIPIIIEAITIPLQK